MAGRSWTEGRGRIERQDSTRQGGENEYGFSTEYGKVKSMFEG